MVQLKEALEGFFDGEVGRGDTASAIRGHFGDTGKKGIDRGAKVGKIVPVEGVSHNLMLNMGGHA